MPYQLGIVLAIGVIMLLGGIYCGYQKDTALPSLSLIYMAITGLGYLIGYGAQVLKTLFYALK